MSFATSDPNPWYCSTVVKPSIPSAIPPRPNAASAAHASSFATPARARATTASAVAPSSAAPMR